MSNRIEVVLPPDLDPEQQLAVALGLEADARARMPAPPLLKAEGIEHSLSPTLFGQIADIAQRYDDLAKVVIPHHSQIQQRTRGGRFLPQNWRREAPRDTRGRFTKRLTAEESAESEKLATGYQQSLDEKLRWTLSDVNREGLTAAEGAERGKKFIAEHYTQIFRCGMQAAGNPGIILAPRDKAVLTRIIEDEGDYWAKFMGDVASGRGRLDYGVRQQMYTHAAKEAFWVGWLLGNWSPLRRVTWGYGATEEHCTNCRAMVEHGPWTVEDYINGPLRQGILPQSGYLECKGIKCDCNLKDNT